MAEPRTSTVIGVFDEYSEAQATHRELAAEGITPEAVRVHTNMATGAAGRGTGSGTEQGGVSGFFHRIFGAGDDADAQADHYAEAVRRGNTVLAVTAPVDKLDRVVEIMNRHGATDIDERVKEFRDTGYVRFDPNAPPYSADEARREHEEFQGRRTVPVIEEEIAVGKRAVRRGGVRVYTHVVEEPFTEDVKLHEEHAKVERRKVDRPVEAGDETVMRDQTIEVTETVEEPVISKRARVKEEIEVGKETTERTEHVRDTVRHTEVKVEPLAGTEQTTTAGTERVAGTGSVEGSVRDVFRRDYDKYYGKSGITYDEMEPAYQFGFEKAQEPAHRNETWAVAESALQKEFETRRSSRKWSEVRGAVHAGWNHAKGE